MTTSTASEFKPGAGKISATLSVVLGALVFGGVLCLLWPEYLTTEAFRALYPMPLLRAILQTCLVIAFGTGVYGVVHGAYRGVAAVGLALTVGAALLGGADVPIDLPMEQKPTIGLDWFVLNLFFTAVVFVPLERLWPRDPGQNIFRPGFATDLVYFAISHVLVQVSVLLTMLPATTLLHWAAHPGVHAAVAALPASVQFCLAVLCTDLFGYVAHRLFHAVPYLWRYHAIHHSSTHMDWLAGSRLHIVDIVLTRAVGFVPLYVLGFAPAVLTGYLAFVSVLAVLIHANVRINFGPLKYIIATPQFHHWHHAAEPQAIDKNFSVHLPWIDRIFGTYYMPKRWPNAYGIAGTPVPEGYWRQLRWPFQRTHSAQEQ